MNSSTLTLEVAPRATRIAFTEHGLVVSLEDGRNVEAPLAWYPRLEFANAHERGQYEFFQGGIAVHWLLLDEDIRVIDLLAGRPSKESPKSLERWKDNLNQQRQRPAGAL